MEYGVAFGMALAWAVLGLIVAIPASQILRMWGEGALDGMMAAALGMAMLVLVAFTWQTQGTFWMIICVALLLGLCIGIPLWSHYTGKRMMNVMREEDIDKCRRAIEADPNNASAHVMLGDVLMKKKSYVAAAVQFEKAIALACAHAVDTGMPGSGAHPALESWKRKLRQAEDAQTGIDAPIGVLVCDRCARENTPDRKKCEGCGLRLQLGFGK